MHSQARTEQLSILVLAVLFIAGCALGFDTPPVDAPDAASDPDPDTTGDVSVEPSLDTVDIVDAADAVDEETGCPPPLVDCSGECVDTRSDPEHCGSCDHHCPEDHAHTVATCADSACGIVCETGWVDNDEDPDCETPCAGTGVESCNGLDDDCDGETDELYACVLGTNVLCDTVCGTVGTGTCTLSCQIPAPLDCDPPSETCNGVDDDCDDVIDNGFDPPCIPCEPDCSGRECGPDPECGESCGSCTSPEVCNAAGQCVESCTPDCGMRECGPDPECGESCGSCIPPQTCNASGTCVCVPDCGTRECGPDPVCGVSCGTCTPPATCNGAGECICIPSCGARECGPDPVCSTSCGTCTSPETCNALGECVCIPDCGTRECGPDPVCGLSCGICTWPETCNASGVCECVPDCSGRECGPDPVCGESCGTCTGLDVCDASGTCVPSCTPDCTGVECGPDPVCGTMDCGSCTSPETCQSGSCVCVPDCSGRECGPDPVCGVSCGSCTSPDTCDGSGACVCIPDCTDTYCGPDPVCGVSCGTCTSPSVCTAGGYCCTPDCSGVECGLDPVCETLECGTCTSPETCNSSGICECIPDCTGKECGADGCGGSCGTCLENELCDGSGTCVCQPWCAGLQCGPDGCGGSCGSCTSPQTCDAAGSCTTCSAVHHFTFDGSAEGWTAGGVNSDWGRGAPTSGPGAAWGGSGGLWATDLAGDAAVCADSWVESPAMDLSAWSGHTVTLVFWTWYEFSPCDFWFVHENYSGGVVEVFDGATWHQVTPVGGYEGGTLHLSDGTGDEPLPCDGLVNSIDGLTGFNPRHWNGVWRRVTVDLSAHATTGVKVRFHYGAHDKYLTNPYTAGWYVDEVSVLVDPC